MFQLTMVFAQTCSHIVHEQEPTLCCALKNPLLIGSNFVICSLILILTW